MKRDVLLVLAAGLLLAAGARAQDKAAPLRGEWRLMATRDEKHTDPGCDQSRMIVQADNGVVFQLAGLTMNRGAFQFGTCGKLKSVDLKLADGKTLLGVYELKGDDLVICFAEAGQERPAATAPKGTQWAETWQRARP
jgi:uncharacterized protein (TIGR03067 family)